MAGKGACQVCYQPFTRRMKSLPLPCVCKVCRPCLTDWVLTRVKTSATIPCPNPTHRTILKPAKLKQLLSQEAYLAYRADFDPNPLPICVDGMWTRYVEDLRVWLVKEMTTESCPSCDSLIEKNGGCPHMVCSRCNSQFCWTCKLTYDVHNEDNCTGHTVIVGIWWLIAVSIVLLRVGPMIPSELKREMATYSVAAVCIILLFGLGGTGVIGAAVLVSNELRLPVGLLLAAGLDAALLLGMGLIWQAYGAEMCTILTQLGTLLGFCSFSLLYLTYNSLPD